MAGKKPASKIKNPARAASRPAASRPAASRPAASRPAARRSGSEAASPHKSAKLPRKPAAAARSTKEATRPQRDPARPTQEVARPARRGAAPVTVAPEPKRPLPSPVTTISSLARTGEVEESEAGEHGSLLAGPRNVQPYIARRGEQYMGKEQIAHFQQILSSWKRDLMEEVDRTVSHMKDEAANFPDPNDRATQEEEFSLELRTRDRERKLIRKIDEALKRIEDGTYGYCLETGEEIGIKRLEARPVATLSIEAQERRERRERQYGDRDDRYR
ncbi:MAG: RNA polymerase-binding protein DksA [Gammaproteobacteria bacterium]|nr:RNA polymerase-binding protein DksA [Gammaproteobacteria bacterium]